MTRPRAVIIGSGVAGLSAALALGDCVVVTKTSLGDGSSRWAQGGIAAAVGPDDHPDLHAVDTLTVAGGLADPMTARTVTAAAPGRIDWLASIGARFDRGPDGLLTLGREAGHSRNRIVHTDGDATGAELMRTLVAEVVRRSDIEVLEETFALDLVHASGRIAGVTTISRTGDRGMLLAPAVVLATGGIGRLYAATTNPVEATGDGLAMAIRAGARIIDPEFVQFHPTAMRSSLDPMPLLTEALRGAGARLVDGAGRRFMLDEHPDAELAPRDVVARAIWRRLAAGDEVRLDATPIGADFPHRFPTVYASTTRAGFDPRIEGIPVSPAAHYHMGGIAVDGSGRSTIPGLYACGEASATGLHGANRLASNSLLEGLVFGARIGEAIRTEPHLAPTSMETPTSDAAVCEYDGDGGDDGGAVARLRTVMWESVGLLRTDTGLRRARMELERLGSALAAGATGRNLATVAAVVIDAALARTESRGGHHRIDHPRSSPAWDRHTVVDPVPVPRHRMRAHLGAA